MTHITNYFVTKASALHGQYTYDRTIVTSLTTPIIVTCPTHGDFEVTPAEHLLGQGCFCCAEPASIPVVETKSNVDAFFEAFIQAKETIEPIVIEEPVVLRKPFEGLQVAVNPFIPYSNEYFEELECKETKPSVEMYVVHSFKLELDKPRQKVKQSYRRLAYKESKRKALCQSPKLAKPILAKPVLIHDGTTCNFKVEPEVCVQPFIPVLDVTDCELATIGSLNLDDCDPLKVEEQVLPVLARIKLCPSEVSKKRRVYDRKIKEYIDFIMNQIDRMVDYIDGDLPSWTTEVDLNLASVQDMDMEIDWEACEQIITDTFHHNKEQYQKTKREVQHEQKRYNYYPDYSFDHFHTARQQW